MNDLKIPFALLVAMAAQLAGGVWWVSQQAATISSLEETVSQLGSRMAIEDNVNMRRDVEDNSKQVDEIWADLDDLWDEADAMASHMTSIMALQQRVAIIENTLTLTGRLDGKDGM